MGEKRISPGRIFANEPIFFLPYSDWKHWKRVLLTHQKIQCYAPAMEKWIEYRKMDRKNENKSEKSKQVIIAYLALTVHQSIAQRGHRKDWHNVDKVSNVNCTANKRRVAKSVPFSEFCQALLLKTGESIARIPLRIQAALSYFELETNNSAPVRGYAL